MGRKACKDNGRFASRFAPWKTRTRADIPQRRLPCERLEDRRSLSLGTSAVLVALLDSDVAESLSTTADRQRREKVVDVAILAMV
jgi:hypothetical protein